MIPQDAYIEVTRSFSRKLNLGNYQTADVFSSRKTQCSKAEEEEIGLELYAMCLRDVERDIEDYRSGANVRAEERGDRSDAAFRQQAQRNVASSRGPSAEAHSANGAPPTSGPVEGEKPGNPFVVKADSPSTQAAALSEYVTFMGQNRKMDRAEIRQRFQEFLTGLMGGDEFVKPPDTRYDKVLRLLPPLIELHSGRILEEQRKFGKEVRQGWAKLMKKLATWPEGRNELKEAAIAAAEQQYSDCAVDLIEFLPECDAPDMLAFLKACRLSKDCAAALRDCGVSMREVAIDWENTSAEEALKLIPKGKTVTAK